MEPSDIFPTLLSFIACVAFLMLAIMSFPDVILMLGWILLAVIAGGIAYTTIVDWRY